MSHVPNHEKVIRVQKYVDLMLCVVSDVEHIRGISLRRDAEEIRRRAISEGMPFLTKVMPSFHKHLLMCVEAGNWFTPIAGFAKRRSGPLPLFLRDLVDQLFSPDGVLRNDADPWAQAHIDQITGMFYKTKFGYPDKVIAQKCEEYVSLDATVYLDEHLMEVSDVVCKRLDNAASFLEVVLKDFQVTEYPRHGPGAVAGREKGIEKYSFAIDSVVASVFNPNCFMAVKHSHAGGAWHTMPTRVEEYPPSRVVFVEKDSRGPRTISCEPKELQWLQQAVGRSLMRALESHPLTAGQVNFTDQSINGELAIRSSLTRDFATLDLKDASDLLANALVRVLLSRTKVYRLLAAIRSKRSLLPDGRVVELNKFAPMGSACTFPVESMCFFALCVGTLAQLRDYDDFGAAAKNVYVYGDDIIIPTWAYEHIISTLEAVGLRVNLSKSFTRGPFRESCGRNAFRGVVTTPVRLRSQLFVDKRPNGRHDDTLDVSKVVSLVETSNLLYLQGYWRAAEYLADHVELYIPLMVVPKDSGCLGLVSRMGDKYHGRGHRSVKVRWVKDYQAPYVRIKRVSLKEDNKGAFEYVGHLVNRTLAHNARGEGIVLPSSKKECDAGFTDVARLVETQVRRRDPIHEISSLEPLLSVLTREVPSTGVRTPDSIQNLSTTGINLSSADRALKLRSGLAPLW